MSSLQKYIITGAPGTGKSSLLEELKNNNYNCYNEVSRIIIKEQQQINGNLFPWKNLSGFAEECFIRMKEQLKKANSDINFYDRAIPDIIAYLEHSNLPVPLHYFKQNNQYQKYVFYLPLWEEIYTNDAQRPEPFSLAQKLDKQLRKTYNKLNFVLVEIPKITVSNRVTFVKHFLRKNSII